MSPARVLGTHPRWAEVIPVETTKRGKRRASDYRERKQERHATRAGRGLVGRLRGR